jgi:hypothetical protein
MVALSIKAYSTDLRQKIIDDSEDEPLSQHPLVKRFQVATQGKRKKIQPKV